MARWILGRHAIVGKFLAAVVVTALSAVLGTFEAIVLHRMANRGKALGNDA